ncbi:MAG TPA: serine/threonine-protein kinase, partial [Polyangiaceae bacterium]|nr:serine/threonine-protein kinase [Polyangiaceae bacterium]
MVKHDEWRHGQLIDGRYRIGHELGRGAMGIVYEARHDRLERRFAIKVLRAELASDADSCERFEREARAAGRIGSVHIVGVYDSGEAEGLRYLVMEYLRGETLKAHYDRLAPLPPRTLVPIVAQLLDGLAAAHDAGIVHRDVKPENVYLVDGGRSEELGPLVKIVDFGVSKFRDVGAGALKSRTGVVLGTPHYMAPEQARGLRDVDRRADVFSVGVLLYEGLSGRRPFSAPNVNQLLFKIALEDVPPIEERMPDIDPALAAIVARATARSPDARYQSARLFAADLRAWLRGEPIEQPRDEAPREEPPSEIIDEETRDAALASLPPPLTPSPKAPPKIARAWIAVAIAALAALAFVATRDQPTTLQSTLPTPQLVVPIVEPPP